jgi:hypothetical protein
VPRGRAGEAVDLAPVGFITKASRTGRLKTVPAALNVRSMIERRPFDIDMRPDGTFVDANRQTRPPGWVPPRTGALSKGFALAAVVAGSVIVAGLALSLALVLVPIAIGAALLGYVALRVQLWRMRRNGLTTESWKGNFGPIMAQFEAVLKNRRPRR